MVSNKVMSLCLAQETVSSALAANPSEAPGDIVKRLYEHIPKDPFRGAHLRAALSPGVLDSALQCGRWGPREPSPLFMQAFADALGCLDADPMSGVVSPPLMGSHGTIPLTIIAPLADIARHCSNLIARAENEVIFITCVWSPSVAQRLISNALVELSERAGKRGDKVLVKMMYGNPGIANVVRTHHAAGAEEYSSGSIQLPAPEEIPNLDLEVINLHRLVLGTLHAKFCIVDRKIACLMSSNVEDNANMEMLAHVEGPIVESIRDTALITWNNRFHPSLSTENEAQSEDDLTASASEPLYLARPRGRSQGEVAADGDAHPGLAEHTPHDPHYDGNLHEETVRMQSCYATKPDETQLQAANRQLNLAVLNPIDATGPEIPQGQEMTPYLSTETVEAVPMALVSRPPYGGVDSKNAYVPQNEAWLSLIRNAQRSIFIQTPDLNAAPLLPALAEALGRGVDVTYYVCFGYNDAGEMIPGQGGTNEQAAQALISSIPPEQRDLLHVYQYVGKDQDRPIHASFKSRACHIKLLIVDEAVAIQGSGNQDTQSWFHSQEVNIMIDSPEICVKWLEGIERNQNTKQFGKVGDDGVWRDEQGNPGPGFLGNLGSVQGLFRGALGMFKKVVEA